jgi:hypothetical protein
MRHPGPLADVAQRLAGLAGSDNSRKEVTPGR